MSECAIDDCNTKKRCKGLCERHYRQWHAGKLDYTPPVKPTECSVAGCVRPPLCRGYCNLHYDRQKRGNDMHAPILTHLGSVDSLTRLRTYAPEGEPDECWNWTRGTNKGYGRMRADGPMRSAHVVAWEIHTGETLPAGMVIRHTCDNPPCTNPAHLLLGTHADNVADKVARNRQCRGETQGLSKLTEAQVREIRERCAAGEGQKNVALDYGIKQVNVSLIVRRKTWAHVK